MQTSRSWANLLLEDLEWLSCYDRAAPETDLKAWFHRIKADPKAFKNRVKSAWKRFLPIELDRLANTVFEQNIKRLMRGRASSITSTTRYVCYMCGALMTTVASWRSHLLRHDHIDIAQLYSDSFKCRSCGVEFSDRSNLVKHLRRPHNRCIYWLLENVEPLSRETAEHLYQADVTRERQVARQGYSRTKVFQHARGEYGGLAHHEYIPLAAPAVDIPDVDEAPPLRRSSVGPIVKKLLLIGTFADEELSGYKQEIHDVAFLQLSIYDKLDRVLTRQITQLLQAGEIYGIICASIVRTWSRDIEHDHPGRERDRQPNVLTPRVSSSVERVQEEVAENFFTTHAMPADGFAGDWSFNDLHRPTLRDGQDVASRKP